MGLPDKNKLHVPLHAMVHVIQDGQITSNEVHHEKQEFPSPGRGIRWIHLPENNMEWVAVSQALVSNG
jgi:hypothetical protein